MTHLLAFGADRPAEPEGLRTWLGSQSAAASPSFIEDLGNEAVLSGA